MDQAKQAVRNPRRTSTENVYEILRKKVIDSELTSTVIPRPRLKAGMLATT